MLVIFGIGYLQIYFQISEGKKYTFRNIDHENLIDDLNNVLISDIDKLFVSNSKLINQPFNQSTLEDLKTLIADILENNGYNFFEINTLKKIEKEFVDIRFQILPTKPQYLNQINISGNHRTLEKVIRREISISEGDSITDHHIKVINRKLNRLNLFGSVNIEEVFLEDNEINLDIEVEEKQTGTFQVGLSVGTIDGATFITGLKEKNFGGTGRKLNFLINTSNNNTEYLISTSNPHFLNNDIELNYGLKYNEKDFTKSQSYKLNEYSINTGLKYQYIYNLQHSINLKYKLKDYIITDKNTASTLILNSEGESSNISF